MKKRAITFHYLPQVTKNELEIDELIEHQQRILDKAENFTPEEISDQLQMLDHRYLEIEIDTIKSDFENSQMIGNKITTYDFLPFRGFSVFRIEKEIESLKSRQKMILEEVENFTKEEITEQLQKSDFRYLKFELDDIRDCFELTKKMCNEIFSANASDGELKIQRRNLKSVHDFIASGCPYSYSPEIEYDESAIEEDRMIQEFEMEISEYENWLPKHKLLSPEDIDFYNSKTEIFQTEYNRIYGKVDSILLDELRNESLHKSLPVLRKEADYLRGYCNILKHSVCKYTKRDFWESYGLVWTCTDWESAKLEVILEVIQQREKAEELARMRKYKINRMLCKIVKKRRPNMF